MASSSTSSFPKSFKYDVFLSFRGEDTRTNFIDHLYSALEQKSIYTYKDDERIKKGKKIGDELIKSIEDSRIYIIVFSKNYASSSWCMDELVKIMECHKTSEHTAYPIFYDVEPSEVRKQIGAVGEAFSNHDMQEAAGKWREALKEAADIAGWELKKTADGHEAKFIKRIVEEVSLELRTINFYIDENLVGMETRINDILSSLGADYDDVQMIGIWGMGGSGKTTLARVIFNRISFRFEGKSFIENVREVSNASLSGLKSLQSKILSDVLNDKGMNVDSVYEGKNMMRRMMRCKKVVIVLDDVDHIDQLEALAGDRNWFKPGSIIIITTREQQVLVANGVKIHNVNLLSDKEAICLFGRYAFRREIPQGYEELSGQVVSYAAGLPLTIKVLGSFLCGKSILDWVDALDRIKTIPLEETRKKLELSYIGLDDDYKEIFLDVATILKGWTKDSTIKALESCGFHAKIGLRVLQQKSLINFFHNSDDEECVGMHDHLEEMGRNIVRRSHPDMPNKHSRLWDSKEIEDVLANDLGSEATRCVQFYDGEVNPDAVVRGLRKMRELRFLDVAQKDVYLKQDVYSTREINEVIKKFLKAVEFLCNWKFNQVNPYFPNALRYLRWNHYPFQYLPKTFQANDLGALEMVDSHIVQLWEGGERKVLNKLKFLELSGRQLRTFDLGLTPNLETMTLERQGNGDLVELYIPGECLKLKSLVLDGIKLRKFNLGMTPNLENLTLNGSELVDLHMSGKCLNLTYLQLYESNLRTLDLGLTPNLEKIWLHNCHDLEELHMPHECIKLTSLKLGGLKLRTLNLGRTPNLEKLSLYSCNDLEEVHMAQCVKLRNLNLFGLKLRTFDLGLTPNLKKLSLHSCIDLEKLHMAHEYVKLTSIQLEGLKLSALDLGPSPMLTSINIRNSKLRTLDVSLVPNLHVLFLSECKDLVELHLPSISITLNGLCCTNSMLRTLDLGLTPNLKNLNLRGCYNLVKLHVPIGCLKNIVYLELTGCLAFTSFLFCLADQTFGIENESLELHFTLKSCPFHPNNNSLKFEFTRFNIDELPSLTTSIEELISVGPCACTKLERFSRSICKLQRKYN